MVGAESNQYVCKQYFTSVYIASYINVYIYIASYINEVIPDSVNILHPYEVMI